MKESTITKKQVVLSLANPSSDNETSKQYSYLIPDDIIRIDRSLFFIGSVGYGGEDSNIILTATESSPR